MDAPRQVSDSLAAVVAALERWRDERDALVAGIDAGLPTRAEWPDLPALEGVRGLWVGLRSREQGRRAMAPAPADAGPLNSRALAQRMLRLMHATSPGYLQHFAAYLDMLAGLQDLQAAAPAARSDAAPAPARKRARARTPRRGDSPA